MPRFAANLTYLWAELPYLDRFEAAAEAGFTAVEVQQPYDVPVPETLEALHGNGLQYVLLNAPGPNYAGGARGFAAVPRGEARFAYDMRRAVRYAQALGAGVIHVMSGDAAGRAARDTLIANLSRAAETLPAGLTLTIEPLGPSSQPNYFLNSFDLAAEVIEAVGADNVGLQFDTYHAHDITGDVLGTYRAMQPLIRHVQIGDAPGRVAPGAGDIDLDAVLTALDADGYTGWVAAEYRTDGKTDATLDWMR
ncbi:TIM barrel protein [uncultured Tateyamaria sp.]|uniref:hydroxypyruvate isomerase family protein n=1 Tax=uncultured Tateyamaria sp. TaxID=455651 RepID=UPI002618BB86|nr:TIM barrel protein [uncultured Tateyamaria sp.]